MRTAMRMAKETTKGSVSTTHYSGGFPLGFVEMVMPSESSSSGGVGAVNDGDGTGIGIVGVRSNGGSDQTKPTLPPVFLYNHVTITITYYRPPTTFTAASEPNHKSTNQNNPSKPPPPDETYRILEFAVEPLSISHAFIGGCQWDGNSSEVDKQFLSTCGSGFIHVTRDLIQANQVVKAGEKVLYTYDVVWKDGSNIVNGKGDGSGGGWWSGFGGGGGGGNTKEKEWSGRWDVYVHGDERVGAMGSMRWYSVTNCLLVTVFLTLGVVTVVGSGIRRQLEFGVGDEYGLMAVDENGCGGGGGSGGGGGGAMHVDDIFHPPMNYSSLFCALVGTGIQLISTCTIILLGSILGWEAVDPSRHPSHRGGFTIPLLGVYTFCGYIGGYVAGRIYRIFQGRLSWVCAIQTAVVFPGSCLVVFTLLNIVVRFSGGGWGSSISSHLSFGDVILLLFLWGAIALPLVLYGSYIGYRTDPPSLPTTAINDPTSPTPRSLSRVGGGQVLDTNAITTTTTISNTTPLTAIVTNSYVAIVLSGLVPFSAAYVEIFFLLTNLWMDRYYCAFAFTAVVFATVVLICAEVAVLLVYYRLGRREEKKKEKDHHHHRYCWWWWFAFGCGGSVGGYVLLYSAVWFRSLEASASGGGGGGGSDEWSRQVR